MSGEHSHPDLFDVCASLRADLLRAADHIAAVEARAAALEARTAVARAHKDYAEVKDSRAPFPVDGVWHPLPGLRPLKGSPFDAPDETQDLYVRLYPKFARGGSLSVEVRWVRANGDATGYDEIEITQATASVPLTRDHNEVGERGVGGEWELKLTGQEITCEVGTRYQKLRSREVVWV